MSYIYTYTGKDVNVLDMQFKDICIEDIAHHLALCNRFAGATGRPVSVAQHSVYVSRLIPRYALRGLLHDASEAYLGDMTKWLKASNVMAGYRAAEKRVQDLIYAKFGIHGEDPEELDWADRVMVRYEGMKTIPNFHINHPRYPALTEEEVAAVGDWTPWTWQAAEKEFLARFQELQTALTESGPPAEAPASGAGTAAPGAV